MVGDLAYRLSQSLSVLLELGEMIIGAFGDAVSALKQRRRPVLSVYLRQVYFSGLEAVRIIMAMALIIGTVIIAQIASIAGGNSGFLAGKLMTWIIVRELGPLLVAIIVIARSGTAVAAELSQMKIGGELESLSILGIPIGVYLVMPRILGIATALVMLTIYFEVTALLGGFLVASLGWRVPFELYQQGIFSVLTLGGVLASLVKSALFGLVIASVCCRNGLSVGRSVTQIPQATTRAVMQSLLLILLLDGLMSLGYLL
jgi:phospholipid/cholesterol/gamma-HCH transport system permease protein